MENSRVMILPLMIARSCRAKSRDPAKLPQSYATGFLDSARNDVYEMTGASFNQSKRFRIHHTIMKYAFALCFLMIMAALDANAQPKPGATLIITNAAIYTVDNEHPRAEAVAVIGDRIVAVGS